MQNILQILKMPLSLYHQKRRGNVAPLKNLNIMEIFTTTESEKMELHLCTVYQEDEDLLCSYYEDVQNPEKNALWVRSEVNQYCKIISVNHVVHETPKVVNATVEVVSVKNRGIYTRDFIVQHDRHVPHTGRDWYAGF